MNTELCLKHETLKHGFLVKKNIKHHCWKTRWFALHEDRLNYYSKRDKTKSVGSIPLYRAAITFPVQGYEKREGVFSISTASGRVALLKASDNKTRATWSHAISGVIRLLSPSMQTAEPEDAASAPTCRVDLSELLGAMQDMEAGIPLDCCLIDDVLYHNCFSGTLAVDWIMRWSFATYRRGALVLLDQLLHLGHLQPVNNSKLKAQDDKHVIDELEAFYRFSSLNRAYQGSYMDSSSDSSGSSAGEMSEGDVLDRKAAPPLKPGRVIRAEFLAVRGHLRKKWKVRKVVLRDSPDVLELCSASKKVEEAMKTYNLTQDYKAFDIADKDMQGSLASANRVLPKKRDNVFCISRPDRKPLLFKAEDNDQKEAWIKVFNDVIDNMVS